MALTAEQIRQQVGDDLGIVRLGTATSLDGAGALQLNDVSDDSPFDPGDSATRYDGAGLVVIDSDADRYYRQNLVYVPASQRVTWTGALSPNVTDSTPDYELHLEPFLHPLLDWPKLINRALKVIRRISWEYILLTGNRGYYDLTDWSNIDGVEQIRRLYYTGPNRLQNADFADWPDTNPADWTVTGSDVARLAVINYPHGVTLDSGEGLRQDINAPASNKRYLAVVNVLPGSGSTVTLTLATLLSGGASERTVTATSTGETTQQVTAEIEVTQRTATLRYEVSTAGGACGFWAPMVFDLSSGLRKQIKPMTTLIANDTVRLFVPKRAGVGQFALLRPYDDLGTTGTTSAPDELIKAAVAVQVLDYLGSHPQIPTGSKDAYKEQLVTAADRFRARYREHMRKIAKAQQLWEAGELQSSGLALSKAVR